MGITLGTTYLNETTWWGHKEGGAALSAYPKYAADMELYLSLPSDHWEAVERLTHTGLEEVMWMWINKLRMNPQKCSPLLPNN